MLPTRPLVVDIDQAREDIDKYRRIIREMGYRLTIGFQDEWAAYTMRMYGVDEELIKEILAEHGYRREKDIINSQ